jgi:hypothetical protein
MVLKLVPLTDLHPELSTTISSQIDHLPSIQIDALDLIHSKACACSLAFAYEYMTIWLGLPYKEQKYNMNHQRWSRSAGHVIAHAARRLVCEPAERRHELPSCPAKLQCKHAASAWPGNDGDSRSDRGALPRTRCVPRNAGRRPLPACRCFSHCLPSVAAALPPLERGASIALLLPSSPHMLVVSRRRGLLVIPTKPPLCQANRVQILAEASLYIWPTDCSGPGPFRDAINHTNGWAREWLFICSWVAGFWISS